MILQVSELTYSNIKAFAAANNDPFDGDIYPLTAPMEAKDPFCVYRITKRPMVSKDGLYDLFVEISVCGHVHDQLAGIADDLEEHFEQYPEYHYEGTDTGVEPDNPQQINITVKYNLKMTK